jgi:ketosteroid isomerase-like protein
MLEAMDYALVDNWITEYIAAWRAKDIAKLSHVFSDEITYRTTPFKEPLIGMEAVQQLWIDETEDGEEFTVEHDVVAIEGDIAVIKVDVHYTKPKEQYWKDIWIIQLDDDGLCFSFEEWPFAPPQ